jgi:hypothetical protein
MFVFIKDIPVKSVLFFIYHNGLVMVTNLLSLGMTGLQYLPVSIIYNTRTSLSYSFNFVTFRKVLKS